MKSSKEAFATAHLVFTLIRGIHSLAEEDVILTLKKYNIQYPSFRILWILFFEKKMTMTELSYLALTNISNVYRQLIKLRDKNLVTIDKGKDARIKEISLTEEGRRITDEILQLNLEFTDLNFVDLLEKIPQKELDTFIKVASVISSELIGTNFTDWTIKTANIIKENI